MDALVTTQWLAERIGADDLRIVDATWFLPDAGRDARAEYLAAHIPGAIFFDIDAISDRDSPLPTMLPPAAQFAEQIGALGIGDGRPIVLYDDAPHHTAARAWWMLRHFGIDASLLDGGLAKWRAEGRPLASGEVHVAAAAPVLRPDPDLVRTRDDLLANLATGAEQLVDARSAARFTGQEAETRPGLASGHIPGSANVPYSHLFNPDGTWKRAAALRAAFADGGVALERPVVATCGSGISAAVIVFALHLLGHRAALYDGSWVEWGSDPSTPKAAGTT